jgi:hypothetical protein
MPWFLRDQCFRFLQRLKPRRAARHLGRIRFPIDKLVPLPGDAKSREYRICRTERAARSSRGYR